jgi:hypothetical protein
VKGISQEKVQDVVFRELVTDIPSTTYATFGLYRYPAKFIPQVIAYVMKQYAEPGMSVFDPFAGYGTVGVVSRVYGHDYELWDLNPLLKQFHDVATMEPPSVIDVSGLVARVCNSKSEFEPQWSNISYWYPEEFLQLLYRVWGYYHELDDTPTKKLLLLPLLKMTRRLSYNDAARQKLSKSPRTAERIRKLQGQNWRELFKQWLTADIHRVLEKLQEYSDLKPKNVSSVIKVVDTIDSSLESNRDILITSPPYLQAQEYIRASKMDLFWLKHSEDEIKELGKKEIPYRKITPYKVLSDTYDAQLAQLEEPHLRKMFEQYFWGVLGSLGRLQEKVDSRLCLFVGSANVRGQPVPIDTVFMEHFTELGWKHEVTLVDTIAAHAMFSYKVNPATGLKDTRMAKEHLVILKR